MFLSQFTVYYVHCSQFCTQYLLKHNNTVVPICKNKNGNMTNTANYKPVVAVTVVSMLYHFYFPWNHRQSFGLKANHETDQCKYLLKQTAPYFASHDSSVHAVFLDASKAFEQVQHRKLFEKLYKNWCQCVLCGF